MTRPENRSPGALAGSQPRRNLKPHPVMSLIKINYDPTEPLTPDELGILDAHAA